MGAITPPDVIWHPVDFLAEPPPLGSAAIGAGEGSRGDARS